ncbi:MAG TPA: hypothetical protein VIM73_13650, partial [Polyangiaceae bacterium]
MHAAAIIAQRFGDGIDVMTMVRVRLFGSRLGGSVETRGGRERGPSGGRDEGPGAGCGAAGTAAETRLPREASRT